ITAPANFNPTGQVTRGQFATFLNATINAKAPVDNSKPAVQSVSALNATQVEVKFTQEVDKNSAQTLANYSIGANNPTTAELQADGKTVKLTFSSPTHVEVTNAVLVVEEISTKADTTVKTAKYSQIFTYEDKVKPELVSVEAKTNGTVATSVTVKASEPIQNALVKINGEYKAISFAGTDKATITGLSLDVTKSHTIELINLTDKGNNITVTTSKTFNVEKDTVSPTVTLSAKSDKQILLTFSKSMDVATVTAALAANSAVKDEAFNTVNHNVAAVVADSDNKQFTIDLTSTLYTNKDSRNLTVVLPNTIKDSIGNTITTATQQVTLTKDTVKPVATGYKVIKNSAGEVTDLEVTFSEELIANATPSAPTIVDSNGVIVTLLGGITGDAVVTGDKKVTYSFTTPAKLSGTYNFSFPVDLVTDRAETGNKSAAFGYNVDFGAASGTFKVTSATASSNVITVVFPKAVKGGAVANSATDLNNYTLAGKALPADTTITLSADQKTATITLKSGAVEKTDGSAILTVSNIRSTDGDSLESYTGTVSVDDNTQPVLNSATLTADNKLSVGFNEDLNTTPAAADFVIKINSKTVALTGTSTLTVTAGAGSDAGKYLINLGDLVKQGNAASAGVDGVLGTADDVAATPTYVDVNNDGTYNTNDDIKIGDGPFTDFKFSSSSAITGVTVSTIDSGATTGKDAKNNTLKNGVTVTAK
ncbi:MAG TPA: hypothetical protein VNS08_12070, partial [Ureibacillus sp.]|nr:hypothetical protein [Ureibacillus sp.]